MKSPFCACAVENRHRPGYKGQPEGLNSAHAKSSRLMRMRIILDPPILAVIYGISTEISQISRKISRFQDFNGDFRISRKISDFTRDFRRSIRDFGKWRTPYYTRPLSVLYCWRLLYSHPPVCLQLGGLERETPVHLAT